MPISTNNESDNNKKKILKQTNLRWNTPKKQKVESENKPKIMFGKKITVKFDTSILTPVAVVTKEPSPVYCLIPLRPNS